MTNKSIVTDKLSPPIPTDLPNIDTSFFNDVLEGLTANRKHLKSKYFYDLNGDKLFQDIMNSPSYCPFQCELEIFKEHSAHMASLIVKPGDSFDLIELGPGDCRKSQFLLKALKKIDASFSYVPIDISKHVISHLEDELPKIVPGIKIQALHGEYVDMLEQASTRSTRRKVILFLGANLGNMSMVEAMNFCRRLRSLMNTGDMVIAGIDLKKDPATILAAYNDQAGVTAAFNLNLLKRINTELNADFDISQFKHFPTYDPETGSCKSYLISRKNQTVIIRGDKKIRFAKDEYIYMEISQKYTPEQIKTIAESAAFTALHSFYDKKRWFTDVIWNVS